MSIQILQETIEDEVRRHIAENACRKPKATQYNPEPKNIYCYQEDEVVLRVPVGMWKLLYTENPNISLVFPKRNFKFTKQLYTLDTDPKGYRDQDVVFSFAKRKLQTEGSVFLALATGFGKTTLGNAIASHYRMKTMVLCHIDTVRDQWVEEFSLYSTAKVQHVKGKVLNPDADVYVMGVLKASHFPPEVFEDIGLVIFDEAHVDTETALKRTLLRFTPRFLVFLSATPKRPDGVDALFDLYVDPKSYIRRKEIKPFTVYKIETDFVPTVEYTFSRNKPEVNWSLLITSLAKNEARCEMIIRILVDREPHRKMMVIVDRQITANYLVRRLKEEGVSVARLIGTDAVPDPSSYRVLVAGGKKAGIGFNDPDLEGAVQEKDCKDVTQYEGRIRQHNNVIYDIVDAYETLENHWDLREKWYRSRGAEIVVEKRTTVISRSRGSSRSRGVQPPTIDWGV